MTITLDLPPETEALFQEAARSEGIDFATFLREAAEARLHPAPPPAAMSEAELLDKITEGFSEAFWQRYRALIARRDSGTLTPRSRPNSLPVPTAPKPGPHSDSSI